MCVHTLICIHATTDVFAMARTRTHYIRRDEGKVSSGVSLRARKEDNERAVSMLDVKLDKILDALKGMREVMIMRPCSLPTFSP